MIDPVKYIELARATDKGIALNIGIYAYPEGSGPNVMVFNALNEGEISQEAPPQRCRTREEAHEFVTALVDAMLDEAR